MRNTYRNIQGTGHLILRFTKKEGSTQVVTETEHFVSSLNRYPLCTPVEERSLIAKAQAGDTEARDELIHRNLRLAVRVASQWYRSLPFDDKVQVAAMGLMDAVKSFDPDRGIKFSTYAHWKIRGRLTRLSNLHVKFSKPAEGVHVFVGTGDSDPSSSCFASMKTPRAEAMESECVDRLGKWINTLNERDRKVFASYALDRKSFREVGEEMGVSHQRVQQIYKKLRKQANQILDAHCGGQL